jgi:hypothetical protein
MKFVKQSQRLHLNLVCSARNNRNFRHGILLPDTIRCIICGPSNCGKTNLIVGLLLHEQGLRFQNVYIYSKTLFQPMYQFLEQVLKLIPSVSFQKYSENEEVLSPQEANVNSIIVFDDVACENQNNIRDYFAMGRHKNIDSFYLNQTYSKVPKQLIRDNANLIVLFKQDDVNLRHVYDEHVGSDMSWTQFRGMCGKIWNKPYSYIVINKDCNRNSGCYRRGFDTFIVLD